MSENQSKKNNSITIAIIGLIGTIVTAVFGSPVLVEWIKSQQGTETPQAIVTQVTVASTENPSVITTLPSFNEQILIFQGDFDNDNVSGFSFQGNWQVSKDKNNRILESRETGKGTFGPSDFSNGIIEFRIQLQQTNEGAYTAINFRSTEKDSYALAFLENQLIFGYRENNTYVEPFDESTSRSLVFESGIWYLIRIEARANELVVFIDNNRILSASDNRLHKGGLYFSQDYGLQTVFDDIKVWELK